MADGEDDRTRDDSPEPSLELPSLFRRRTRPGTPGDEPTPVAEPGPTAGPSPAELLADRVDDEPTRPLAGHQAPTGTMVTAAVGSAPAAPEPPAAPRAARTARTAPLLPAPLAAALTGFVVGLVGTGLTFGGLEGCQVVRGTSSCGGAGGLLLLVAILAVMALVGAAMLSLLGVEEPRSTSVLAVGIICVVAMVALLEVVFSGWMFVTVPLIGAAGYLLSFWVTNRLAAQLDDGPDPEAR